MPERTLSTAIAQPAFVARQTTDEGGASYGSTGAVMFPQPSPSLVQTYLKQVAAPEASVYWQHEPYLERLVSVLGGPPAHVRVPGERSGSEQDAGKPETLEEALARAQKMILLGEPGMGKTTCLHHLAQVMADRALAEPHGADVPIYAHLRHYRGEADLEALLARQVNRVLSADKLALGHDLRASTCALKVWLAQSDVRFSFLLDGLNEVRPEFHAAVHEALQALLESRSGIIITCREGDYDGSLDNQAFVYRLQALGEHEIRRYLSNTLGGHGVKLFHRRIRHDERVRAMSTNPSMLRLIALTAKAQSRVYPPASVGKLLQQFVAQMPRMQIGQRAGVGVPCEVVMTALAGIGFEMKERQLVAVTLDEVSEWNIPTAGYCLADIATQARGWRFLTPEQPPEMALVFYTPLLQECFAAVHLKAKLSADRNYANVLGRYLMAGQWEETLVILADITDPPQGLIEWFASVLYDPEETIRASMADTIVQMEYPRALGAAWSDWCERVRHLATRVLCRIGTPVIAPLVQVLGAPDPNARWRAAELLGSIGSPRAAEPLMLSLRDANIWVRKSVVDALGRVGDPRCVELLVAVLRDPDERYLHPSATEALVRIGCASVEPLVDLLRDPAANVRRCAADALGKLGSPQAIQPLVAALSDPESDVRRTAAAALGRMDDLHARAGGLLVPFV